MIRVPIAVVVVVAVLACGGIACAQEKPASDAIGNPLMRLSLDQLAATRERPLFAPTRRPPPPEPEVVGAVEAPPPPPPPPPTLSLFGIVKDAEGGRALVRAPASDKVQRVRVGDKLGGWKVARIEDRKLILELEDRSTTFTLFNRQASGEQQPQVAHHRAAPMVELNAAGILTARRSKSR